MEAQGKLGFKRVLQVGVLLAGSTLHRMGRGPSEARDGLRLIRFDGTPKRRCGAPGSWYSPTMTDELEVLRLVTERLDAAGFAYMLSGSVAMNFYAQPRMTRDVDIVAEIRAQDAARLSSLFQTDFYCDVEDIRQAIVHQSLFNLVHLEKSVKIDVIVRKDSPYRHEEFVRRRRMDVEGIPLWVVSPEDLILSKLFWAKDSHSELQLRDVRNLLSSVVDLDAEYVDRWAKSLGIWDLLEEARS